MKSKLVGKSGKEASQEAAASECNVSTGLQFNNSNQRQEFLQTDKAGQ